MSESHDHFVKIRFRLPQDEDGWPPVESEGVWAEPLGGDNYKIANTPWFVRGLATDDIVAAVADSDGVWWATERVRWSGRLTVRVIPWDDGPLHGNRKAVLDAFAPLGVTGEGVEKFGIVALDIPPDADLRAVKMLLSAGQSDGRWDYEEGCVSDAWLQLEVSSPSLPVPIPESSVDEPDAGAEDRDQRLERVRNIYDQRVADHEREHPGYQEKWSAFRQLILQHGGDEVVPPATPDPLIETIGERGTVTGCDAVVSMRGVKSECHANAVALWRRRDAVAIGTGYALSDDGLWREHSWAWDDQDRVIETSEARRRYFGVRFAGSDAEWFASMISPDE